MDTNMENQAENKAFKKKLSKEELLAGKCSPDEEAMEPTDPRFKSPDEILLQMVSQKRANMTNAELTIQHGFRRGETTLGADASVQRLPDSLTLSKDLQTLADRYENDKKRWKEYEQRIIDWKAQVMNVIQNIREQNDTETLQKEIETLREINRKKDEEIRSLADDIKKLSHKKR